MPTRLHNGDIAAGLEELTSGHPKRLIREQRGGGHPVSIAGRPIRSQAEYRAAHRALPRGPKRRTPAEWAAYIDELEAGATS